MSAHNIVDRKTVSHSRGVARIGVLVPFTNTNLEPDMNLLRPDGVSMHFARLGGYDQDAIPDADQMAGLGASDLEGPLELLSGVRPDVILYGCTSATLTHGSAFDRNLAARVQDQSGAKTVTAAGALVSALQSLGVRQVAFASPYVPAINDKAISFLQENAITTLSRADVEDVLDNYGQGEMAPDAVHALGLRADCADAEALVLSCTDMRSVEVIDRLEQTLGKPVVCSNQAMIHAAEKALGLSTSRIDYGRLLQ